MTREERERVEKHFDELDRIACGLNQNIPNEIIDAMKVAYVAGADYALDELTPHWISVEDELPKDGQYTATINKAGEQDVRHYFHDKWYSNFGNEYDDITHWMPLPAPPAVSKTETSESEKPTNCTKEKGGEQ